MSLKILLNGAKGRMGQAISAIASDKGCEISAAVDMGDDPTAGIDTCDVVIDFSLHDARQRGDRPLRYAYLQPNYEDQGSVLRCSYFRMPDR